MCLVRQDICWYVTNTFSCYGKCFCWSYYVSGLTTTIFVSSSFFINCQVLKIPLLRINQNMNICSKWLISSNQCFKINTAFLCQILHICRCVLSLSVVQEPEKAFRFFHTCKPNSWDSFIIASCIKPCLSWTSSYLHIGYLIFSKHSN